MIQLIIGLIVVGVILWAIESFVPLDPIIKRLIQVVLVLAVLLYLLQFFGVLGGIALR